MDDARGEFLTFRSGQEEYAIDILTVREIRASDRITRLPAAPADVRGVIDLRGAIVAIVDLRAKLGTANATAAEVIVILALSAGPVGLLVDAVIDVMHLDSVDIRPAPDVGLALEAGTIRGIAAAAGRMLVVLDIERLMGQGHGSAIASREAA